MTVAGPFTVAELAAEVGGEVEGDGELRLVDGRGLADARGEHLSFCADAAHAGRFAASGAGAVIVGPDIPAAGRTVIRCGEPKAAFARALALFHPVEWPQPGVDPAARVADDAVVDGATVEAFAWVGPGARVGAGSWVEAGAYVGRGAAVGERCRLMPSSIVLAGSRLGDRVWLNPGVVVGGQGFGFVPTGDGNVKLPQVGSTAIEDDVEIGANTCVDRAAMGETRVRRGAKLDNLVQIGHGADIGEDALLAAYVGIAGSTRLGRGVMMGGKSGAADNLEVGDGVQVYAHSSVLSDQPAGARVAGTPAVDHRVWLRASVALAELPKLIRRVRRLEKELASLREPRDPG